MTQQTQRVLVRFFVRHFSSFSYQSHLKYHICLLKDTKHSTFSLNRNPSFRETCSPSRIPLFRERSIALETVGRWMRISPKILATTSASWVKESGYFPCQDSYQCFLCPSLSNLAIEQFHINHRLATSTCSSAKGFLPERPCQGLACCASIRPWWYDSPIG